MVGYSGTPLVKKLGFKSDTTVAVLHAPSNFFDLLVLLPERVQIVSQLSTDQRYEMVITFQILERNLAAEIDEYLATLLPSGSLWVCWYKKAAKQPTDLTEDVIRRIALDHGVVDVKVIAVDEQWSGLKLVRRVKDR
jgi:hypothetical protein